MSSPTDRTEKHEDPSAYAPKWVRDSNRKSHEAPRMPEANLPPHSEQSVPENAAASDQARAHRAVDTTFTREARLPSRDWRSRAESEVSEDDEEPSLKLPRSLDPQFLREPPRAPRLRGPLTALGGLAIAGAIGAAIALLATGKVPSELNKTLGFGGDKATVASKPAGAPQKTPEQLAMPAAQLPIASADPRPIGEDLARVASVQGATERAPTVRGVTDNE